MSPNLSADESLQKIEVGGILPASSSPSASKFGTLHPLSEPKPHPIASDNLNHRFARASMLSELSVDYAAQAQKMVEEHLELDDPYRGNSAVALLVITAVRESLRAARGVARAAKMEELFAKAIRESVDKFEADHPHIKQARDVIAHVDEYVSSRGHDTAQWFDATNRFDENYWVFRIGNKLDIDMVNLVAGIVTLADFVNNVCKSWIHFEAKLEAPSNLVEELMDIGIYASVRVIEGIATIDINKVTQPTNSTEH